MFASGKARISAAGLEIQTFVDANARLKALLLVSGAILAVAGPIPAAFGQEAPVETIIVTGSRITAAGFAAPTPTTVVGTRDIEQSAQPNLFTTISQLPAIVGSVSTQSALGATSLGNTGLSSISLHNLGTNRSLTLLDGQRYVPAFYTGIVDVSGMPQLLVQRVDVVTGGASASWGSDAVGGVVNFITNKNFNGIKGNISSGVSNYNDAAQATFQVAAGTGLLGGKAHIEGNAEFYHNDGVDYGYPLGGPYDNTRGRCCDWGAGTLSFTTATATGINGVKPAAGSNTYLPQFTRVTNVQGNATSLYGLITAGPLIGLAFNADGTLSPFQFGTVPAGYSTTGTTGAAACVGTNCVGGDRSLALAGSANLEETITRTVFYTRGSYNITPDIELYGTVTWARVFTRNFPQPDTGNSSFTIACGNATGGPNFYVPAAVNAACVTNKITSFKIGETFRYNSLNQHYKRTVRRYVGGADGSFDLFGQKWSFDSYFEHGETNASLHDYGGVLVARELAAVDAVAGPNGTVICRANATTITAPGCAPFSFIGGPKTASAALNYVSPPGHGSYALLYQRQEAAALTFNGVPFKDWAGEVALAFGVEYREEAYHQNADPYGNGVTADSPLSADYPADPLLDLVNGNNWRRAQYHNGAGNYHVSEGFAEFGVPLLNDTSFGKVDLSLAGRATWYSTAGYVNTWKVGATWETPLPGLRFRALQSRDVRAPNLQDLFNPSTTNGAQVSDRTLPSTAAAIAVQQRNVGNLNLVPEKAANTEAGLVYQHEFIPGLSLSADYWRVAIKGQINTLSPQQVVDLCQLFGNTSYCAYFNLKGVVGTANPAFVLTVPFNVASTITDGFDIEAGYQFDLQDWDVPGGFSVRTLASRASKYITDSGIPGQPITETAGTNADPHWKINMTESWRTDEMSFTVTERWFSNGVQNPYGIVCAPGTCPAPTAQHPTYAPGSFTTPANLFVDIGATYKITPGSEVYFKVDNLDDRLPGPVTGAGNDPIGRQYRVGLRFNN